MLRRERAIVLTDQFLEFTNLQEDQVVRELLRRSHDRIAHVAHYRHLWKPFPEVDCENRRGVCVQVVIHKDLGRDKGVVVEDEPSWATKSLSATSAL